MLGHWQQLASGAATVAAASGLIFLIITIRGSDACTAYALYKMRPPQSSVLVPSKAAIRCKSLSHRSFGPALVTENDGRIAPVAVIP